MNKIIVFVSGISFFALLRSDTLITTKTDAQIVRLQLLYYMKMNCQSLKDGDIMVPLCHVMKTLVDQLNALALRGNLTTTEAILPILETIKNDLENIKVAIKTLNKDLKITKYENEDQELLGMIENLSQQLESQEKIDIQDVQKRLLYILTRYKQQLNK